MKILQLNVWGGRLGRQVIDLLNREAPDVACLQEPIKMVGGSSNKGTSFLFDDIDEIQAKTGFGHCFFTPTFGYKFMKREAQSGLAILSRQPFTHTHAEFVRLQYISDFDILDTEYNVRCLQHAVIANEATQINVLNHHGHHVPDHKNGDEETMRQCKLIADYIEKLDGPAVLCGDFNLSPGSESLQILNRLLINHVKECGVLTTRTPLTHKTEVCDYIFTSPGLVVSDFQVLDDLASDHKALTVVVA